MSENKKGRLRASQELEQASEEITRAYPAMWHNLYLGLQSEGFTEPQALELLKTFIQSFHA